MSISDNLIKVKSLLNSSCKLIAVSKTHPVESIEQAYRAGQKLFGENKVQELVPKYEALNQYADIEWHLIGHLQTNKVKYVAPFVAMIHSVDSLKLLQEINKQAQKTNRVISCLLQVHIAQEETKFGFSPDEVLTLISSKEIDALRNIKVEGLMGMATLTENTEQIRKEFKSLKSLFEEVKSLPLPLNIKMKELSMGMSSDFHIAMEEGSTMVRVGSAIFGQRQYNQP